MMDNYQFSVKGETREIFDIAMSLAFKECKVARAWAIDKDKGFILMEQPHIYSDPSTIHAFPFGLSQAVAGMVIWEWLQNHAEYSVPPVGSDAHYEKGFRIWNAPCGGIDGYGYSAFVGIQPAWAVYGK